MGPDDARRQLQDEGWCVVPGVLSPAELEQARTALERAIDASREAGVPAHDTRLDPNASNIRVYNLPARDPFFVDLMRWPSARTVVEDVLGPNVLLSNFTANIALPGSGSMRTHSDQALSVPEPWDTPWVLNIIWCLDDVHADNGATRYVPGSHRWRTFADVPADPAPLMRPFEAPAGSFIAMDGRLWHTSGANVTVDEQRRMLFAYYGMDFIRPQITWAEALSPETKAGLDDDARKLLGVSVMGNTRIGGELTRLSPA
jgi:ectoine hydroxylase-related dioxygenase (phytanoyl-CoA dioxygenase family)